MSSVNVTEWKPTQIAVLTFDGQNLPKKGFVFILLSQKNLTHTLQYSISTVVVLDTAALSRSKPRCFRCGQDHPSDKCLISEEFAHCKGNHFANNSTCLKLGR